MSRLVKRRTGRNSRRTVPNSNPPRNLIHQIQDGKRLFPLPHPPEFTSIPWFQLTVRIDENLANVTVGRIATALLAQLRLQLPAAEASQAAGSYRFRVHSVRVWGSLQPMNSGSPLSPLTVNFYNVSFQPKVTGTGVTLQNNLLQSYTDYPDQVSRPCIGFEYPIAQQAISLGIEANPGPGGTIDPSIFQVSQGGTANSVAYVRLLWRPNAIPQPGVLGVAEPAPVKGWSLLG